MRVLKLVLVTILLTKLLIAGLISAWLYPSASVGLLPVEPTPTPAINTAINRETSQPYTGSFEQFEDPDRDAKLQVDRVMDTLAISQGKSVADIGAGSGWFTVRAAKRVGEKGKVFAVDINPESITYISDRAKRDNLQNIQAVLSKPEDPSLPANSVDAVLILKTYHEFSEPVKVMLALRSSLKRGALVGIIDKNGSGEDHGIGRDSVVEEMARAGYVLKEEFDFVKGDRMDYFLVFRAK